MTHTTRVEWQVQEWLDGWLPAYTSPRRDLAIARRDACLKTHRMTTYRLVRVTTTRTEEVEIP